MCKLCGTLEGRKVRLPAELILTRVIAELGCDMLTLHGEAYDDLRTYVLIGQESGNKGRYQKSQVARGRFAKPGFPRDNQPQPTDRYECDPVRLDNAQKGFLRSS